VCCVVESSDPLGPLAVLTVLHELVPLGCSGVLDQRPQPRRFRAISRRVANSTHRPSAQRMEGELFYSPRRLVAVIASRNVRNHRVAATADHLVLSQGRKF
jgi:hypothetical protein